jgi:aminoglycoside phosphotransferase (APT) family kinase protein
MSRKLPTISCDDAAPYRLDYLAGGSPLEVDWERPPRVALQYESLAELVEPAFPGRPLEEYAVLESGLANTNVRFRVRGDAAPYVLRLHTRDATAAKRELALMKYLADHPLPVIPVPALVYTDTKPERGQHPYSIWRFVDGTLLAELFGTLRAPQLVEIAGACARVLAALSVHRFGSCGGFGPELEVVHEYGRPSRLVPEVVHRALFEGRAGDRLGLELRDALWSVVERTSPRLTAIDDRYTLVHGDYKRSNLLITRTGAVWSVKAVLDWEFACAGPPLIDVGLFLRAGDALPEGFRENFASCYRAAGGELPGDWLPLSRLVDVLSQVTFLDDPRDRPRVFAETTEVVKETIRMLS